MCFTPIISLSTAIFEFLVAAILLLFFKKSLVARYSSIFIFLLGFYQFTEFMVCTTSYSSLWAMIGFITYTFLPAVGLHIILGYTNKKYNFRLIYFLPVIFSLFALMNKNFITIAECSDYFVKVFNIIYDIPFLKIIYILYYLSFIIFIIYILINHFKAQRNIFKKELDIDIIAAILISLIPALILIFFLPSLRVYFPSIYCQFAVLYTFGALIGVYLESKFKRL